MAQEAVAVDVPILKTKDSLIFTILKRITSQMNA